MLIPLGLLMNLNHSRPKLDARRRQNYMKTFLMALLLCAQVAQAQRVQELRVDNSFSPTKAGFDWTVFINEDSAVLNNIACVEYTLHPTFPNRTRKVCDKSRRFALSTSGWGEFTILLKIEWRNGRITRQTYHLDLHTPARRRSADRKSAVPHKR